VVYGTIWPKVQKFGAIYITRWIGGLRPAAWISFLHNVDSVVESKVFLATTSQRVTRLGF
jgi:hypothetical protein